MEEIGIKDTFHLLRKMLAVTDNAIGTCGSEVGFFKTANAVAILVLSGAGAIKLWRHIWTCISAMFYVVHMDQTPGKCGTSETLQNRASFWRPSRGREDVRASPGRSWQRRPFGKVWLGGGCCKSPVQGPLRHLSCGVKETRAGETPVAFHSVPSWTSA